MDTGLSRPQAYDLVQRCAMIVWQTKREFKDVLLNDRRIRSHISASDIESCFDVKHYTRFMDKIFRDVGIE